MSYQNISVTNKLFRVRESTLWLRRVVTASLIYQVTDKLPGKCVIFQKQTLCSEVFVGCTLSF